MLKSPSFSSDIVAVELGSIFFPAKCLNTPVAVSRHSQWPGVLQGGNTFSIAAYVSMKEDGMEVDFGHIQRVQKALKLVK
jgi:hypothetical protein